jgi:hypothetical protein
MLSASLLIILTGCALLTVTPAPKHDPAKVACESFRVIKYDRLKDTDETIAQALSHNAAWHALCDGRAQIPAQPQPSNAPTP